MVSIMNNDMNGMHAKVGAQDTPGMIGSSGVPKFSELMFAVTAIGIALFVIGFFVL